jgi:hypothetical protein
VAFIAGIRRQHPQAAFIQLVPETQTQELNQQANNVIASLNTGGEKNIHLLPMQRKELTGCQWHPSLKDHQSISKSLIDFINANPQFWKH